MSRSPLSVSRFRQAFILWWLTWGFLHAILIMKFGYDVKTSTVDSAVTNIQLVGACWMVSTILKYYLPQKEKYWYILILSGTLSAIILGDTRWILMQIFPANDKYLAFVAISWPIRFGISFLLIGCMTILSLLWFTLEEEQENQKRQSTTERLSKEAELYKLRQQLQPHFLFNSLNSISALVGTQPEQARKMIQQLSDFLRGTLKKEEQQSVMLDEELQYLELYLDIEKVRFGHRLTTSIEKDDASRTMKLPAMLLQPLVENAIKFGLYDTTEAITIRIHATSKANELEISVENPFDPETSSPKHGTGFGLSSIQRRLYLLFARTDLLETKAINNLFITIVKIPQ